MDLELFLGQVALNYGLVSVRELLIFICKKKNSVESTNST